MSLLEVESLTTEFRRYGKVVRAVDNVSFQIDEGETLALVGESGCGKSVTALSIMRLVPEPAGKVVSGAVHFRGRDLLRMGDRELRRVRGNGIAMIFQDPMTSLDPVMPIGRQITESLALHLNLQGAAARRRAIELLDMVGIPAPDTRLRAYPHQLSGGTRQRVMIAIALSCAPALILADEITTALDVTIQAQILELLRTLTDESGTAVMFITHDLGVVAGVAERVNVMYAGRIVEAAPTDALFDDPRMPYTWGLLGSVPRLDQARRVALSPIGGQPPDLGDPPPGCRFAPRCRHVRDICHVQEPELVGVGSADSSHRCRCWGAEPAERGGWIVDAHRRSALLWSSGAGSG